MKKTAESKSTEEIWNALSEEQRDKISQLFATSFEEEAGITLSFDHPSNENKHSFFQSQQAHSGEKDTRQIWNALSKEKRDKISQLFATSFEEEAKKTLTFK